MRKAWQRLRAWAAARWLELVMMAGLIGIIAWFGVVAYSFVPKPPPSPTPGPTAAPTLPPTAPPTATPSPPARTPGRLPQQATPAPAPTGEPASTPGPTPGVFEAMRAYEYVLEQISFGPHPTGSEANLKLGDYVAEELRKTGWEVEFQEFEHQHTKARNIIARAGQGPVVVVGAHYDARARADEDADPAKRDLPVPAANDGASGVAVLLELGRSLDKSRLSNEVWLTFFDAEDSGGLDGWDFLAGSRYMVDHLEVEPQYMVLVNMVGDADQQIYKERTSTAELVDRVWAIAAQLNYGDYFKDEYKWPTEDDHTPFLEMGVPAVDLIDSDYAYWHTTEDTADKVSPASLEHVGRVLQVLLEDRDVAPQ